MRLVSEGGTASRGLARPDFCDRRFEYAVAALVAGVGGHRTCDIRRHGLTRQNGQRLLHDLELPDRPPKLHPDIGAFDGTGSTRIERERKSTRMNSSPQCAHRKRTAA